MAFETGGGGGRGGKKKRATPSMNVTPLVDVVLVLLIIFMVITPMLAKQFWVHVPAEPDEHAEPAPPREDGPPVVTVDADGVVRINHDEVPLAELEARVTRILAARTDRTVFFDAASDAPYGRAVEVLDTLRGGGATTIAVATEPLADAR
ncbi:MAG: biopolymer transporter ExbD [Sandaracinus sp.]